MKHLTNQQKEQIAILREDIKHCSEYGLKEERKARNRYYDFLQELDSKTVVHQGFMYNGKPYYVTVEDVLLGAWKYGWDKGQE